jgi:mRNA interferase YafQ
VKRVLKRGKDLERLLGIVQMLADEKPLPAMHRDHPLKGEYSGKRDCHIEPDWILIYAVEDEELILYRTGSHADLFR